MFFVASTRGISVNLLPVWESDKHRKRQCSIVTCSNWDRCGLVVGYVLISAFHWNPSWRIESWKWWLEFDHDNQHIIIISQPLHEIWLHDLITTQSLHELTLKKSLRLTSQPIGHLSHENYNPCITGQFNPLCTLNN